MATWSINGPIYIFNVSLIMVDGEVQQKFLAFLLQFEMEKV